MRPPAPWLLLGLAALLGCPADGSPPEPTPEPVDDDDSAEPVDDDDDSAQVDDDDSALPDPPALTTPEQEHGLELYTTYCVDCHGAHLQGYVADWAPAMNGQHFLTTATDAFIDAAITHGRPGTVMSAWGADYAGPMTPSEISDIVAYVRAWQTEPTQDVHDQVVEGDAEAAELLYLGYCAECHGAEGEGETGPALNNPWFLHTASDGYIRYAIEHGRERTPMAGWGKLYPDFVLDDMTAWLRAWQTPVEDTKVPPFDPDLTQPVINEGGPAADFSGALDEALYVSLVDLVAAYDAGQAMVLLDARPGSDYVVGHITGAISTPFYRVQEAAPHLPDDLWLVAYCGCPHTLSGDVATQLSDLGFPQVAVLDEGWFGWLVGEHPVTVGAEQY